MAEKLKASSGPGGGAVFKVTLPVPDATASGVRRLSAHNGGTVQVSLGREL